MPISDNALKSLKKESRMALRNGWNAPHWIQVRTVIARLEYLERRAKVLNEKASVPRLLRRLIKTMRRRIREAQKSQDCAYGISRADECIGMVTAFESVERMLVKALKS